MYNCIKIKEGKPIKPKGEKAMMNERLTNRITLSNRAKQITISSSTTISDIKSLISPHAVVAAVQTGNESYVYWQVNCGYIAIKRTDGKPGMVYDADATEKHWTKKIAEYLREDFGIEVGPDGTIIPEARPKTINDIRIELRNLGFGSYLIGKMSDEQLKIADACESFENLRNYMDGLAGRN